MKKTSKVNKEAKPETPALKKAKNTSIKSSPKKRIKDEEEDEDFIPMDDELTGLDIYDDEDDDF